MGTLTIATFQTLDGIMQAPGGPDEDRDGGFEHGGWSFPYFSEDMGDVIDDAFGRADCFLLGRRTYEIFAASWPNYPDKDDPVASRLNTWTTLGPRSTNSFRRDTWSAASRLTPARARSSTGSMSMAIFRAARTIPQAASRSKRGLRRPICRNSNI
jgi:dihydrofolate reductase